MKELLISGAEALGLSLSEAALSRFEEYYRFLTERNAVMNLTAISGEEDTAQLHFLDCMALAHFANFQGKTVVDIGSGAGFPGMVLKIAVESLHFTAVDAQRKRMDFLSELSEKLKLEGVSCLHLRAEEAPKEMRGRFDFAVSRAVAELRTLCELTLPFVKVGGELLAMKGPEPEEELAAAKNAIRLLGGETAGIEFYTIPGTDIRHSIIRIRKAAPTPEKYPRRFAKIQKNPL